MQNNLRNLTTVLIGIITGLIVIVGIFIPLVGGLEDNMVSTYNNYTERFMVVEDDGNLEITRTGNEFNINGTVYTGDSQLTVISESVVIKMTSSSMTIYDADNNSAYTTNRIVFDDGQYTYANGGNTYTGTYDMVLYPHPNGDYACFYNNGLIPFSSNIDDTVYTMRTASTDNYVFVAEIVAGEADGYLFAPKTVTGTTMAAATASDIVINVTAQESADGLSYSYTSIKGTIAETESNLNVYAPISYSAIDANAETVRNIVGVLPIVMIIGLLIMAAYVLMQIVGKTRSEL